MILDLSSSHPKTEQALPDGSKLVVIQVLGSSAKYPKEEFNRNLFRLGPDGQVVWRVEYHEGIDGPDPFVGVRLAEDGKILGFTWSGWQFEVRLDDGSLKELGWSK